MMCLPGLVSFEEKELKYAKLHVKSHRKLFLLSAQVFLINENKNTKYWDCWIYSRHASAVDLVPNSNIPIDHTYKTNQTTSEDFINVTRREIFLRNITVYTMEPVQILLPKHENI